MKTLYLVDLFSFIFRAYYAIRPLSSADGTPVNAVYGVVTMLSKLISQKKPDHLIICADSKEKNFRHEIYPAYKANRSEPPADLISQIDLVFEFLKTYPFPIARVSGFEADDIIATLTHRYSKDPEMQIYIVTSDKDLMQLVSENVFLYDTLKNKISSFEEVFEKFGVKPHQVVEVQALCGDSSDNIPGIPGVGPKTATQWIQAYGTLENTFENAPNLKGKWPEKILQNKELALLSKKLVALDDKVPLEMDWDDMALKAPQTQLLNAFYERMNFKSLIKADLDSSLSASLPESQAQKFEAILLTEPEKILELTQTMASQKSLFAFDTETTGLNTEEATIVGFSFCFDLQTAYYIPLNHVQKTAVTESDLIQYFKPLLEDPLHPKVAQNAKFDLKILKRLGIDVKGLTGDTLIASYLIEPDGTHNLDFLAQKYLNHTMISFKDVVKKGETFADVDLNTATLYAAEDAFVAYSLNQILNEKLKSLNLETLYKTIELPLISVLAEIEDQGVLINELLLSELEIEFKNRILELEKRIFDLAGTPFNIQSPKQLQEILFVKLGLPIQRKTKTGYSTDVDVLEALKPFHPLAGELLNYRALTKLLSTYVVGLKEMLNPQTKRIHTHFNQTIAATGRLSSTEPNLQNIPIKTEEGRRLRELFIAPKDCVLLSCDYSQIELRLLAEFTKDPHLNEAYLRDEDIHAKTASVILGIPIDQVTSENRNLGKTINFGVVYGQSPFGLSKQLGIPQAEAKFFIDSFYQKFSKVKTYKEEVIESAKELGYVQTYLGRKRFLPDLKSSSFMLRQNAERVAFNTVFQGSAADLIKKAMLLIHEQLLASSLKSKMILQVHDELVFEVFNDEIEAVKALAIDLMTTAFKLQVPLKVSTHLGRHWSEAH